MIRIKRCKHCGEAMDYIEETDEYFCPDCLLYSWERTKKERNVPKGTNNDNTDTGKSTS